VNISFKTETTLLGSASDDKLVKPTISIKIIQALSK